MHNYLIHKPRSVMSLQNIPKGTEEFPKIPIKCSQYTHLEQNRPPLHWVPEVSPPPQGIKRPKHVADRPTPVPRLMCGAVSLKPVSPSGAHSDSVSLQNVHYCTNMRTIERTNLIHNCPVGALSNIVCLVSAHDTICPILCHDGTLRLRRWLSLNGAHCSRVGSAAILKKELARVFIMRNRIYQQATFNFILLL
jgi:hypothetical protein